MSATPIKPSDVIDRKTVIAIVLITLALGFRSSKGMLNFNVQTVASTVFQVSGTMFALALPAAEFAFGFIIRLEDSLTTLYNAKTSPSQEDEETRKRTDEAIKNIKVAYKAVLFVLYAFILSAAAIVAPSTDISLGYGFSFAFDNLLTAAALSVLIIGSYGFYPAARNLFELDTLNDLKKLFSSDESNNTDQINTSPPIMTSPPVVSSPPIITSPPSEDIISPPPIE